MKNVVSTEMSTLNITEIVNTLSNCYINYINNNHSFKDFPSVMIWGMPGVGKSEGVREIASNIEQTTKKKVVVTDVRLLLFNPIDLRGIPVANEDRTLAVWLKPQIFQMDPSNKVVNILFLDEISAAPQSVQAAAYQITLDRKVGEHTLPDNCIIIAAGNRVTDKSVAYKMPKALANRLLHMEAAIDFKSWKNWAVGNNINEKVLAFLCFRPDHLCTFDAGNDSLAFATPRSWVQVSNILNNISDNIDDVYPLVSGLVGSGSALEFRTYCNIYHNLPDYKDVYNGKVTKVPGRTDVMYALIGSLVMHIEEYITKPTALSNLARYAQQFPNDFSTMMLTDLLYKSPKVKKVLLAHSDFMNWVSTRGSSLNGII